MIANYPTSSLVPTGLLQARTSRSQRLGETDRARESFETVIKQYPDSPAAILAQQRLERLNRPTK